MFSALIIRDIKQKYKIRNTSLLEKLNSLNVEFFSEIAEPACDFAELYDQPDTEYHPGG